MEKSHTSVPSVKIDQILASYIFSHKFHFKFSVEMKIVNFNKKSLTSF